MRKSFISLLFIANVLFITNVFKIPAQQVDSIIDFRDDQIYKVVKIGQQWWMQENLNIGTRIDGTKVAMDNNVIEKYCYDDLESNCNVYGGLYQWNEMMDYNPSDAGNPGITQGICPIGWHLPTDSEWTELTDFLGGESIAGGKMKETGTVHWLNPNTGATNTSGFTGLPGGCLHDGYFYYISEIAFLWSSSEYNSDESYYRKLYFNSNSSSTYPESYSKEEGYSIRCLRDSCQFAFLTILDKNLENINKLNFTDEIKTDTIIFINSSAGETITISLIQTNTSIYQLNTSYEILLPGESIYLTVTFNPPDKGKHYLDTIQIESNDPYQPELLVPLDGYLKPDSIIDIRDEQVYKIVKISQQWWMQENLNIGTRIDGTKSGTDDSEIEKYCYDDLESNCDIYGGLYQWDEMMEYNPSDDGNPGITKGICPVGWHLPTDEELKELEIYLGMSHATADNTGFRGTNEGGKMKEAGTTHWNSPNEGATNETGFTALPGGSRSHIGTFSYFGNSGYWWSSTEYSTSDAWYRHLAYNNAYIYRQDVKKLSGFSVRCLRDSSKFSFLTVSNTNFNPLKSFDFYGDNVQKELIIINSNAGEKFDISTIYTENTAYKLNKSSANLSPGDSIHMIITFDPPAKNIYLDTLFIESDDPYNSLITIPLNGTFPPEISFDSTNISCFGYSDGSVTVIPSLGTSPYQYQWDDPENTTDPTATGLEANIYYHITVTDGLGWTVSDSIILSQPLLLTSKITDSTNISCFGYSDGEAVITPSGGTIPYSFTWDDKAGTTDSTATGLSANQYYHVTISDANGCKVKDSVMLSEPSVLLSSVVDSSNISCYGFSDGSATITVNGGTRPYIYLWDDQEATADSVITGLSANKHYYVNITDAHGCSTADSVILSQPDILAIDITDSTNISCYNDSDGTAMVTASGGTIPYIYSWDNPGNSTDNRATGLSANIYYHVTVTDAHSCPAVKDSVILSQPLLLVIDMTDSTSISCNGFADGTATITPSGGSPPYYYQWDNPGSTTDSTVTGLSANKYCHVNVTDDHGCSATDSIILSEPPPLEINPTYSDTICLYSNEGYIKTDPSGGTPPYDYIWSTGDTDQTITSLETGNYGVKITDSHGCTDSLGFTIFPAVPYDGEKICVVTIDLLSGNNIVVWEKTNNVGISAYNIYRESTIGIYNKIGTVLFDKLSIFKDTTANPENQAYLYKITVVDTCGNESPLEDSKYHRPSFLQYVSSEGGVNLMWSDYNIQGIADIENYLTSYVIYRGTDSTGLEKYHEVGSINTYTDTDPAALKRKYYYRVAAILKDPCIPTTGKKAEAVPYSHSMSNIEDNRLQTGIPKLFLSNENLMIYPNPFNESTTITFKNPESYSYTLCLKDLTGKVVKIIDNITDEKIELNRNGIPSGLYLIELRGPDIYRGKVVIE